MATLKYVIAILLFASPVWAAYDCNTLNNDSVTDNTSALNTCLSNAALEDDKTMNVPSAGGGSNDYRFESDVTIPENVIVNCAEGAAFEPIGEFVLSDGSQIVNCEFDSRSNVIKTPADGTKVTGAHVRDCEFITGSGATVFFEHADECIFDGNTVTDDASGGQNFVLNAGTGNIITNNTIAGGKTCIILKYDDSQDTSTKGIFDTIVMDNTCSDLDEEGITVDMGAGSTAATPMREADQVSSVNGADVTLSDGSWAASGADYTDYYMVVVTDNDGGEGIEGEYRKISSQSGATITLASAISGLEANDWVSITAIAENIYIAFNVMSGGGYKRSNILLYGPVFNSRVEENTAKGIGVRSLDESFVADDSVTGNGGRGPASFNVLRGNTVNVVTSGDCDTSANNCDMQGIYNDIGETTQYTAYKSYGNVWVDNTIGDDLILSYQDYYTNNNTISGVENFSDSTDAGSTSLDTTDYTCEEYQLTCVAAGSTVALVNDLDDTCSGDSICAGYGDAADISTISGVSIGSP